MYIPLYVTLKQLLINFKEYYNMLNGLFTKRKFKTFDLNIIFYFASITQITFLQEM